MKRSKIFAITIIGSLVTYPVIQCKMRYNCTIIDLYDRSVAASLNSGYINMELAVDTFERAINNVSIYLKYLSKNLYKTTHSPIGRPNNTPPIKIPIIS